ncbi:MAG: two-component sensor histidine kinase [Myxococcaceae bacterium]|nr:MAG: two-component sensor histidine kinase [Myxococcaceae bacterium]
MKARVAAIAFLLAVVATGLTWLSFQPVVFRLVEALRIASPPGTAPRQILRSAQEMLPVYLGLDLLVLVLLTFGLLYLTVARPLASVEREMQKLERLDWELDSRGAGPLLSRFQASLRRTAEALQTERNLTRRQLEDLAAANDQLTRAQAELVASERLATVGRLAAGVAHEIGNPLSGLLGWVSLAHTRAGGDSELGGYLREMESEVRRIDGIVRSLLDLGRPPRTEVGPVLVAPLVRSAAKLVGSGPEFREVTLEIQLDEALVALADPGRFSQVLINLLINAAQAIGGPGRIAVVGQRAGERVRIDVMDSGPGVPTEIRDRIFEPFFTTKSGGKGTGLGLAVSQHLMRAMSGDIAVGDSPRGGGKFTVTLPAA